MTTESNMKFSVRNYGPIAKAEDIELRPLTVFVGPSNTGKSYLAVLIYAFFRAFEITGGLLFNPKRYTKLSNKEVKDFFNGKFSEKDFISLPEGIRDWINKEIAMVVSQSFRQEINRCMGISSRQEKSLMRNRFNFCIENDQVALQLNSLSAAVDIRHLDFTDERFTGMRKYFYRDSDERSPPVELMISVFLDQVLEKLIYSYNAAELFRSLRSLRFIGRRESFYLPAARTGIMQSHRAIAGALVQRATHAGIENLSIPTLSGILSDFLQEIIQLNTNNIPDKNVGKIASEMEDNVLQGIIKTTPSESGRYPEFAYKQKGLEIPLLRSSSMVSELAPIVLLIRHRVGKGDLLIIEEPESHLHPAAQRNIAEVIVKLVRAGVRIIVTTHSDYFLEQLGNYVLYSQLPDKKKKSVNGKAPSLSEEEIGTYSFQKKARGTIVKKLPFDRESGFSPEDHNQVSSDIYNQTVKLLDRIESGE